MLSHFRRDFIHDCYFVCLHLFYKCFFLYYQIKFLPGQFGFCIFWILGAPRIRLLLALSPFAKIFRAKIPARRVPARVASLSCFLGHLPALELLWPHFSDFHWLLLLQNRLQSVLRFYWSFDRSPDGHGGLPLA